MNERSRALEARSAPTLACTTDAIIAHHGEAAVSRYAREVRAERNVLVVKDTRGVPGGGERRGGREARRAREAPALAAGQFAVAFSLGAAAAAILTGSLPTEVLEILAVAGSIGGFATVLFMRWQARHARARSVRQP